MARKRLTEAEKQAKREAEEAEAKKIHRKKTIHDEIWAIVILAIGVFLALTMFTNTTGVVGQAVKKFVGGIMGPVAYALPIFLIIYGVLIFANKTAYLSYMSIICIIIFFILICSLVASFFDPIKTAEVLTPFKLAKAAYALGVSGGGVVGTLIGSFILTALGKAGLWIIGIVGALVCCLLMLNTPLSELFDGFKVKAAAAKKVREEQLEIRHQEKLMAEQAAEEERIRQKILAEEEQKKAEAEAAKKRAEEEAARKAEDLKKLEEAERIAAEKKEMELPKLSLDSVDKMLAENSEGAEIEHFVEPEMPEAAPDNFFDAPENPQYVFGDEYTDNQKNILGLVTDEHLFGKVAAQKGKGLNPEEPSVIEETPAPAPAPTKVTVKDVEKVQTEVTNEIKKTASAKPAAPVKYQFPSIDLLKKAVVTNKGKQDDGSELSEVLEKTLASFGVDAKVVNVTKGPSVTRFEVQPGLGVKVAKISGLHDDLALNLRAKSLRIEAPIPGKAVVGIEVSNQDSNTVYLREVIDSKKFKDAKSKITVALGRGISGDPEVANLKEMPHLLIAGSTGSGKSVCINSFLISLMYKATPDQVKLILIDPKVVELSDYNGIPHLLIPVVTEPAKASAALGWAVGEMNDRYNKFANESVRDLESYNELMVLNGEPEKVMPQIVIVVDELNDLMMSAKSTVEDSICRLAQKARAAGMHLVVATQRPSVDVLTGVIKANIPSRIAFAVSNLMDSRTILDEGGAEHLLGKGDMLYAPQGSSKPARIQGCFVSDSEVKAVIEAVKANNNENKYDEDVVNAIANPSGGTQQSVDSDDDEDPLYNDACETVIRAGECSVSMLQRRFRIGYNHAARLVDIMEERGIVGPADGARKRKVLVSLDEFTDLQEAIAFDNSDIPEEI